jgi:PAS domain S-box-containing protein
MTEDELFRFLENTADAAFAVTEIGEIRSWNRAAERLFGYRAAEAIGRCCQDVLKGQGVLGTSVCQGRCSVQQQVAGGREAGDFDLHVTTATGERIWVNVSTLFFHDARRGQHLIVHLARDISERKRKEDLLARFVESAREVAMTADGTAHAAPISPLTEQEVRILRLFANGKNSSEIARTLGITLPTLRNHLHGVNEKLRTHNRLEAVMHAMKRGLI